MTLAMLVRTLEPVSTVVTNRPTTSRPQSTSSVTRIPRYSSSTTVCTGAGLAARAGVLNGRNGTTNKLAWARHNRARPPHALDLARALGLRWDRVVLARCERRLRRPVRLDGKSVRQRDGDGGGQCTRVRTPSKREL
ncbi:hypothetical protein MMC07_005980 [Pseudocyphellaria aurata]|nr:hypothetical protein [Pseudocyphellaria aurata]